MNQTEENKISLIYISNLIKDHPNKLDEDYLCRLDNMMNVETYHGIVVVYKHFPQVTNPHSSPVVNLTRAFKTITEEELGQIATKIGKKENRSLIYYGLKLKQLCYSV